MLKILIKRLFLLSILWHLLQNFLFCYQIEISHDGILEHGGRYAEVQAALRLARPFAGSVDVSAHKCVSHAHGIHNVGDVEDLGLVDGALVLQQG